MRFGDMFSKIWYCTNLESGIRPLCTPDDPHAEGVVCGFRWKASFIPEDFEQIEDLELVPYEKLKELRDQIDYLARLVADEARKKSLYDAAADEILRGVDMNAELRKITEKGA